ncbi:hypothetical protein V6N13_036822 [Hibiscus sabdariffa]|uniref:Uncharacterized protein n=1 Tax=Hibiscus sabdariffa TaxID=183260 RepID=A0ABR2S592_9ROSI
MIHSPSDFCRVHYVEATWLATEMDFMGGEMVAKENELFEVNYKVALMVGEVKAMWQQLVEVLISITLRASLGKTASKGYYLVLEEKVVGKPSTPVDDALEAKPRNSQRSKPLYKSI